MTKFDERTIERATVPAASWTALALLTAAYTLSFVDRTAVSVVQGLIKTELRLSDWQIGLMIGPAFAIVYSLAGLPLARLAERGNRAHLLAGCVAVWSVMTMACGMARDFTSMYLARMGVGIGEAGGNPASHSLIADLFPETRRSTAIAIYTLGAPLGSFIGAAGIGWLTSALGWRQAFLVLGVPGFLLAVIIWIRLHDHARETESRDVAALDQAPSLASVARDLSGNRAFLHLVWGGSLVVLVGYCLAAFLPALLVRSYQLPLGQVGLITGAVAGLGGGIGTMLGGLAGDRWGSGKPQRLAMICALAVFPAPLVLIGGILSHQLAFVAAASFLGMLLLYAYIAPAFTQVHALAGQRTRATVTSIYYLITNLIGLGIGPPLVGALSDLRARHILGLDSAGFAETCLKPVTTASAQCAQAIAGGMEAALLVMSLLPLLAGVHFIITARLYRQQAA